MGKLERDTSIPRFLSTLESLDYSPESSGSTVPFEADMSVGNVTTDEGYQTASAITAPEPSDLNVDVTATRPGEEHSQTVSDELPKITVQHESPSYTAPPEPGLEILGRGMREMVEVINRLRQVGVEDFVLPLPKIAGRDTR